MKSFLIIYFLFVYSLSFSQNFESVDLKVSKYPEFENVKNLSIRISNDFDTDIEKVRAAFFWISTNLTYNKSLNNTFRTPQFISYFSEFEKNKKVEALKLLRIKNAFLNKKGICFDYASLFNQLCEELNLQSILIKGIVKEEIKKIKSETLYKNHAWNAVKINNQWKLFDCTWASYQWDFDNNKLLKKINNYYFDIDPNILIKSHYPENKSWQFLDKTITLQSFFEAPIFFPDYFKNKLELLNLNSGQVTINANDNNYIRFTNITKGKPIFFNNSKRTIKKAAFKNVGEQRILKFKTKDLLNAGDYLTLYLENKPILKLKLESL